MSGFIKRVLKNLTAVTLISPWFHYTFRLPASHVNGQKIEKGGQWKEDKWVEEEKKDWLSF